MAVEESLNKLSYKVVIVVIKVLPILVATLLLLRTVLYCIGIDAEILSYLVGMSLSTIVLMYALSYVFRFCSYHRMFIHYIVVHDGLNYIDYVYGIPLSYVDILKMHLIIAGIFLLVIIYLHQKCHRRNM